MNNNTQSSEGVAYDVNTGNVCTVGGDTVQINHELVVDELPLDTGNTDLITIDAFHRFHKLPIESLPGGNPFDQDLNTFDNVEFGNSAPIVHQPTGATIQITNTTSGSQITTYNASKVAPELALGTNPIGQYYMWACYLDDTGTIRCSGDGAGGSRRGAYFVQTNDSFFMHAVVGLQSQSPTNDIITMEWREGSALPLGSATLKLLTRIITPTMRPENNIQTHTVGIRDANQELCTMPRASLFGQDLTSTSNIQFNQLILDDILTLNNTPSNNSNNKFLTLDEITNVVELGDLEIVTLNPVGGAVGLNIVSQDTGPNLSIKGFLEGDLNIKLLTTATDLTIALDTIVSVVPQMAQVVGTNNDNELIKQDTGLLFNQQLLPTSDTTFNKMIITTPGATTANYDNIVIDGTSGELKTVGQAYTTLYSNVTSLITIAVINTYVKYTGVTSSGLNKNCNPSVGSSNFTTLISGRGWFNIDISCTGTATTTKIFELALFKNNVAQLQSVVKFTVSSNNNEFYTSSSKVLLDFVNTDVFDIRLQNTTDINNINIESAIITLQSIII